MDASIDAFIAEPSPETLAAAKDAWLTARDDYGPTEAFRFYGGPIDNEENGVEGLINAWPLDEAYIDTSAADPMPALSTCPTSTRPSMPTYWSHSTSRAARPISPLDGTPSSSSYGARIWLQTRPGTGPSRTTSLPPTPTAAPPTWASPPISWSPIWARWSMPGLRTPRATGQSSSPYPRRRPWA